MLSTRTFRKDTINKMMMMMMMMIQLSCPSIESCFEVMLRLWIYPVHTHTQPSTNRHRTHSYTVTNTPWQAKQCMHTDLLVCLFVCLFVCLLACLFACLFVCLFVCLFLCLLVCVCVVVHEEVRGCGSGGDSSSYRGGAVLLQNGEDIRIERSRTCCTMRGCCCTPKRTGTAGGDAHRGDLIHFCVVEAGKYN